MALSTPAVDLSTQTESGVKVKQEKNDEEEKAPTEIQKLLVSDQQLSRLQSRNITITVTDSKAKPKIPCEEVKPAEKTDPPPIDYPSVCGAFGWTTLGPVHLPVILRGEEKFVAVRMFECKIVFGYFPDIFPPAVFSCTNINSYYITENEAKLLHDINCNHCDYQFGYSNFSTKDYVVRLKDATNLFEFLECCKARLYGSNSNVSDKCGFLLNYKIPYVRKGTKKYISLNTVYPEDVVPPVTSTEVISNWDLAYFRFLSFFASLDLSKLELNQPLCNVEDLESTLGGISFEEVTNWPEIRFSSKEEWSNFLHPRTLRWISKSVSLPTTEHFGDSKKLRKKISELQDQESMLNSFLGLSKYLDMNAQAPRPAHLSNQEPPNGLNIIQSSEKANIYPVSLENFLSNSSSCNYPYPVNFNHFNNHIQAPSLLEYERYRKTNGNLPSKKSRSYPPPPPLVRVSGSRTSDQEMVPKSYLSTPSAASCPPWYARILEPDWLHEDESRNLQSSETPENLSRRFVDSESRSRNNNYDLSHDRLLHSLGGSPRLLGSHVPPPHYPTPPQSSPLQPLLDYATIPGFTEIYAPNGLVDLCSPPPSPDMRTAISPRSSHLYGYQPHIARWVSVDSRNVLAINVEPLKYHSHLAVPLSLVVTMFLSGVSVQSCQMIMESVLGLHLYDSTSLHQEAFAKYNLTLLPGSKLVSLSDLKSCIYQLKVLSLEKDKTSDGLATSDLPLAKRWCGDARDC